MKINKKMFSLFCAAASVLSAHQVLAQTSVVDGGFETSSGGTDFFWQQAGSQPPQATSAASHTGTFSMDIAVTNATATGNVSLLQQNTYQLGGGAVNPGDVYNFSFWAKQISFGPEYVQNYDISWLNSMGGIVTGGNPGFQNFLGGNGVWSQISVTNITAPAGAVGAYIQIEGVTGATAGDYGEVLIDDVVLTTNAPGGGGGSSGSTNLVAAAIAAGNDVSWTSTSGAEDQVQRSTSPTGPWTNFGSPIAGVNGTGSTFDATKGDFYQVIETTSGGSGGNVVTNGGFETAGSSASVAANWAVTQAAGGPVWGVRTNDGPNSGSFNFEVHLASTGAGPVVRFEQDNVPVTAGTTYTFSFYSDALTGSAGDAPQWDIQWFGLPGTTYISETGFHNFTPGANMYAQTTSSVTAPTNATTADVVFYTPGAADITQSATIRFDDVSLSSGSGGGGGGSTNTLTATAQPGVKISWLSGNGTNYQVQATSALVGGGSTVWSNVGGAVAGNGSAESVVDASSAPKKFYQVLTQ